MLFGGPVNERYLPEILPFFFSFPFLFFLSPLFVFFVVFPGIVFVCTCVWVFVVVVFIVLFLLLVC